MDDPGKVWEALVESARRTASTTASAPSPGRTKLLLRAEGAVKHLPGTARSLAMIPPPLRDEVRRLVAGEAPWPLFVSAPAGVGKTCAALCLLDHAGGLYYTATGLASAVIEAQQGRLTWREEARNGTLFPEALWRWLAREPLVVLDELGSRDRVSDHHYECVKRLLDERHGKPLVVLSNLDLARVGQLYDDRVASRLAAGTVIRLEGRDRRLSP